MKAYKDFIISPIGERYINSKKVDDKIVSIKLNEVKDQLIKIQSERKVKDLHLVSLLRSYDLVKELKNVVK